VTGCEKIGRLTAGRDVAVLRADEAAFDAVLFNLQVIGESFKQLPEAQLLQLPEKHRSGPARLRDLVAHHYFSLDPSIIHDVATRHVPDLLRHALDLRQRHDEAG
jgi:uncharacterized protein with HEPN domain